jgi:hypothetical protein
MENPITTFRLSAGVGAIIGIDSVAVVTGFIADFVIV